MFTCLAIIYSSTWIGALRCRLNRLTKYLRAPCRTSTWYSRISKLIAGPTACLSVGTNLISTTLSKIRSCGIKEVNLIKTWRDTIKIYLLSLIFHTKNYSRDVDFIAKYVPWVVVVTWFGLFGFGTWILTPAAFKIPCCTSGFVATSWIPWFISVPRGSLFWLLLLLLFCCPWLARPPRIDPRSRRTEIMKNFEYIFHPYDLMIDYSLIC